MSKANAQELAAQLDKEQIDTVRRDVMNHEAAALLRAQDALLRQALGALEFHQRMTRPITNTIEVVDKIKEHLK